MSVSCTVSDILSLIFKKHKEVTWPWTHPFRGGGGILSFVH